MAALVDIDLESPLNQLTRQLRHVSRTGDTFAPMSVAVLVKMPPTVAVARAIAIDVVLFAIIAVVREKISSE